MSTHWLLEGNHGNARTRIGQEADGRFIAELTADDIGTVLVYGDSITQAHDRAVLLAIRIRAEHLLDSA